MNHTIIIFFLALFFNITTSRAQYTISSDSTNSWFQPEALLKHVESLSSDAFEGRRTGNRGAIKTKNYIVNQFHSLKVLPLAKNYQQPFVFTHKSRFYKGSNVLGVIKGSEFPEKYIVISAHYDHEGIIRGKIYNGADDNASGISALFSFAEYFKTNAPKHSVILAAFDGEELGLQGSKYFVNHSVVPLEDIVLNINMDMISRSNKNELFVVGASKHASLKYLVKNTKHPSNIELLIGHDDYDGLDDWSYSSDHANFHKKEIPFLYFGVEDHTDYHEPTDDFENIHPDFYINAVKTIISVFKNIDTSNF